MCHDGGVSRALYHAAITRPSHACGVVLRCKCTTFGLGSIETPCGRAAVEHFGRLQWSLDRTLSKPAETSHSTPNHHLHALRLLGRYSPRPSWGFPSRPRRRACGTLSGRRPLASQYTSLEPIRCILNASSADRPVVAAPFLGSSQGSHLQTQCMQAFFGQNGSGLDLQSHEAKEPSRPAHKC